jgi:negative regulator of sigma E activity
MTEHQRQLLSAYLDDALDAAEASEFFAILEGSAGNPQLAQTVQTYVAIGEAMRGKAAAQTTGIASRVSQALRDEPLPLPVPQAQGASFESHGENILRMSKRRTRGWQWVVRSVAMAATAAAVAIGGMRLLNSDVDTDPNLLAATQPAKAELASPAQLRQNKPSRATATIADGGDVESPLARRAEPISPTTLQVEHLPVPTLVSMQVYTGTESGQSTQEWDRLQPNVEARVQAYFLQHSEVTRNSVRGMLPYARLVGYESARD